MRLTYPQNVSITQPAQFKENKMFEVVESEIVSNCEIVEYNETSSALAMLAEKYATVVFDVSTKTGLEQAKSARSELRGYRTNLETLRKSIKAPALNRCRLIDEEAKSITEKLVALEKPIAQQIEAEESRKAAEKQAELQAEIERVTKLRAKISAFTELVDTIDPTSDACQAAIVRMKAIPIDDTFEELQPDAQQAKDAAMFRLQNLFAQYTASEAEAARIKEERAELDKLREADRLRREEDDRKAAEERARLQREQDERIAAEVVRLEAEQAQQRRQQEVEAEAIRKEQQAQQSRLDAMAAELHREQVAAGKAEHDRAVAANAADDRLRTAAPLLLDALIDLKASYIGAVYDSMDAADEAKNPVIIKADAAIQAAVEE